MLFLHELYVYIYIKKIHKIKKKTNAYNVCHLRFVLNQATAKAKNNNNILKVKRKERNKINFDIFINEINY